MYIKVSYRPSGTHYTIDKKLGFCSNKMSMQHCAYVRSSLKTQCSSHVSVQFVLHGREKKKHEGKLFQAKQKYMQ